MEPLTVNPRCDVDLGSDEYEDHKTNPQINPSMVVVCNSRMIREQGDWKGKLAKWKTACDMFGQPIHSFRNRGEVECTRTFRNSRMQKRTGDLECAGKARGFWTTPLSSAPHLKRRAAGPGPEPRVVSKTLLLSGFFCR